MNSQSRREQAMVGLFVLIAGAMLVGTVYAVGGFASRALKTYHAYFPFAGGVEPGTQVRYSGGPKVGRVEKLQIDPQNPERIDVTFTVNADLPVKTDSRVKIMSMTPLGDNHVEIIPGNAQSPAAPAGSLLPSENYVDLSSLLAQFQDLTPQAQQLLATINSSVLELKVTLARVNNLINDKNSANLSGVLADSRALLQESRPEVKATLQHLDIASSQLQPVLDDLRKTAAQATQSLDHVDALIGEDRPDIHRVILQLRESLDTVNGLTGRLDQTVNVNSDNIDEVLHNLRDVTENLKELTDTIKVRPYLLIRSAPQHEHKPGDEK